MSFTKTAAGMSVALAVGLAPAASADPVHGGTFPVTCDGVPYTFGAPGIGRFPAAHVLETGQVFVPLSFSLVSDGEVQWVSTKQAEPAGQVVDCSYQRTPTDVLLFTGFFSG
jgi:hypothetical protein